MDYTTNINKIRQMILLKIEQLRFIQTLFLTVLVIGILFTLTYSHLGFTSKAAIVFGYIAFFVLLFLVMLRKFKIDEIKSAIRWIKDERGN